MSMTHCSECKLLWRLGKRVGNGLKDNGENFHDLNLKSPPMRWIGETLKAMRFDNLSLKALKI